MNACRRLARRQRRLHRVEIVLAEEDDRHLLERGEIQALGTDALFRRRIPEEDDDHAVLAFHPRGQPRADRYGHRSADNRRGPGHADALVDQVHRAAARRGAPVHAAVHLAQHRLQVAAFREVGAMGAVARVDEIRTGQRRAASDCRRFLADDQMDRRLHLILVVAPFDLFLDAADAEHGSIEVDHLPRLARVAISGESADALARVFVTDHAITTRPAGTARCGTRTCRT